VRSDALGFFICRAANAGQNILQLRELAIGFWTGVEKRQSFALLPALSTVARQVFAYGVQ
jgi:hypothetical protein